MRNKIKAVRKRPGEAPEIIEIENTEEALVSEVGGEITGITPLSDVKLLKKNVRSRGRASGWIRC